MCKNDDRWSEGPPEESAQRWSALPPLGDDSSSSESVSQSSILPYGELDQPVLVRRPVGALTWALIALVILLAVLIGVVVLARAMRPWLASRRAPAEQATAEQATAEQATVEQATVEQATAELWLPRLDNGNVDARRSAARAAVALGPKALCRALDHISKGPNTS